MAKGEYFSFIDDDDLVSEEYVDGAEEPCNDFKNNTGNFKYFDYV